MFDVSLTLALVGFLLSFYSWALVTIRVVALMGLLWAVMSYAMQWIYGNNKFKWWVHLLGMFIAVIAFLILSVVFNEDIKVLGE